VTIDSVSLFHPVYTKHPATLKIVLCIRQRPKTGGVNLCGYGQPSVVTSRGICDDSQATIDVPTRRFKINPSKLFIRYGSSACWIHAITIKYKYKLVNKNIKI